MEPSVTLDARSKLIQKFSKQLAERLNECTALWFQAEDGEEEALPELKRVLHTIKGEAFVLGIEELGKVFGLIEEAVEVWKPSRAPLGNAILGGFDVAAVYIRAIGDGHEAPSLSSTLGNLKDHTAKALAANGNSIPAPTKTASSPDTASDADESEIAETSSEKGKAKSNQVSAAEITNLRPVLLEINRLHAQQTSLLNEMQEIERRIHAYAEAVDPSLSPEEVKEQVIKTLGYGSGIERTVRELRSRLGSNHFSFELALSRVNNFMRNASLVGTDGIRLSAERVVRTTSAKVEKQVELDFDSIPYVESSLEVMLTDALGHLIRNAIDHGMEETEARLKAGKPAAGKIIVRVTESETTVRVSVVDDGGGVNLNLLREKAQKLELDDHAASQLVFEAGLSTKDEVTDVSGRGVGLDSVANTIRRAGGQVYVEQTSTSGTTFILEMPINSNADTVLPVRRGDYHCCIPVRYVVGGGEASEMVMSQDGRQVRDMWGEEEHFVPLLDLGAVLGASKRSDPSVLLGLEYAGSRIALALDSFTNPEPINFSPVKDLAVRSNYLRGVAASHDGNPLLLLDVPRLFGVNYTVAQESYQETIRVKKVIVAEDAPVARELICGVMRSFGYEVFSASDGREAIRRIHEIKPDLIMTDLEMPYATGFDVIKEVRDDAELKAIPIIVLTTRADEDTRSRARTLGASAFLAKQRFSEGELKKLLLELLGDT